MVNTSSGQVTLLVLNCILRMLGTSRCIDDGHCEKQCTNLPNSGSREEWSRKGLFNFIRVIVNLILFSLIFLSWAQIGCLHHCVSHESELSNSRPIQNGFRDPWWHWNAMSFYDSLMVAIWSYSFANSPLFARYSNQPVWLNIFIVVVDSAYTHFNAVDPYMQ